MKVVIVSLVMLLSGCANKCIAFDRETGDATNAQGLSCDLMIDGRCEYYSRTQSLIPTYNELKP